MFRAGVQSRGVSQRLTDAKPKDCNERRIHPQPEPTQPVYITETAPPNLVKGAIGALLGSLIGGAVWGGIGIGTGMEVGYVAIGVGALAGIGASKMGWRQKRGAGRDRCDL
jgi:predicted lipid-binding transport protein (Tim44 family)